MRCLRAGVQLAKYAESESRRDREFAAGHVENFLDPPPQIDDRSALRHRTMSES